jgi:hypothetical protein
VVSFAVIHSVEVAVSTERGGTIRTMKELSSGFIEVIAPLIRTDRFDRRSSTHFHISDNSLLGVE